MIKETVFALMLPINGDFAMDFLHFSCTGSLVAAKLFSLCHLNNHWMLHMSLISSISVQLMTALANSSNVILYAGMFICLRTLVLEFFF